MALFGGKDKISKKDSQKQKYYEDALHILKKMIWFIFMKNILSKLLILEMC